MSSIRSISYYDIATFLKNTGEEKTLSKGEFVHYWMHDKLLGTYQERRLNLPHIDLIQTQTDLHDDLVVKFQDTGLQAKFNICISLNGVATVKFNKHKFEAAIADSEQHGLYIAEPAYDLTLTRTLNNVHLSIDLDYYLDLLDESEEWARDLRNKLSNGKLTYSGETSLNKPMERTLAEILCCRVTGSLGCLVLEAKILELIALQLQSFLNPVDCRSSNRRKQDRDVFYGLRDHLQKTYLEDHSLKDISRSFGLNEFKLKKGFKEEFGTTVFEFIHDLRMKHAKHLLADEGLFVNEVAGRVGYKNPNHFSTAFKKKFGMTPASLR